MKKQRDQQTRFHSDYRWCSRCGRKRHVLCFLPDADKPERKVGPHCRYCREHLTAKGRKELTA